MVDTLETLLDKEPLDMPECGRIMEMSSLTDSKEVAELVMVEFTCLMSPLGGLGAEVFFFLVGAGGGVTT